MINMLYTKLAKIYEKLESTRKKLEKTAILAEFYTTIPKQNLEMIVLLSQGIVYPRATKELGIATNLMLQAIAKSYGVPPKEVEAKMRSKGDVGLVAEHFASNKKQQSLMSKTLSVVKVYENIRKLPDITGSGSQDKKLSVIQELLVSAKPQEAKYISKTVIENMRIGVADGIIRDSVAKAFKKEPKEIEKAYNYIGNYGQVALLAKQDKLSSSNLKIGSPIRVMLADRSKGLKEAHKKFKNIVYEIKYDGFRCIIHKDNDKVYLFSRRLDNVSNQFPDIVKYVQQAVKIKKCIIDSEVVAINKDTGKPMSFQTLSRRIKRKYDIHKMVKEIPVQVDVFDIIYNGENLMDKPLRERWKELKKIIKETEHLKLADHRELSSIKQAEKFLKYSQSIGEEGLMAKNLDAKYQPGKRVGYWLKIKEIMDPLDLVIIGGTWSEGKRAKTIGSLLLGARQGDNYIPVGMMGSGLKEKEESTVKGEFTLSKLTKLLKKDILEEKGNQVTVQPKIVVEVGYEEIQKSLKYPSGFALRFPRLLRFRTDEKRPKDADTVKTVEKLYRQQRGRDK
ncbi:DNA ligase [archaeon]|nr:DNA ligase [archaeon]|tara:strand:- start:1915 stop:3606 length:1692 start_codon:yes stop_codon:yes gene_type:complete